MERFKLIMKKALAAKAIRIKIERGKAVQLVTSRGPEEMQESPEVDDGLMQNLYKTLFPKEQDNIQAGKPTKGQLMIVDFGKLKLIAEPAIGSLKIFVPPEGEPMFQTAWETVMTNKAPQNLGPEDGPINLFAQASAPLGGRVIDFNPAPLPLINTQEPQGQELPAPAEPVYIKSENPFSDDVMAMFNQPPIARVSNEPPAAPTAFDPQVMEKAADLAASPFNLNLPEEAPLAPTKSPNRPQVVADLPPITFDEKSLPVDAKPFAPTQEKNAPTKLAESRPRADTSSSSAELVKIVFAAHVPGSTIERKEPFPIDTVLQEMIKRKASDLHLTAGEPICLRVDGDIVRMEGTHLTYEQMEAYMLPIMPPMNREEFAKLNDTDFAYEVPGLARFRVNMFRDLQGVGAVLRQIPSTVLTAKQLNLPPAIRKFCELTKGLVVVTGPTGSGKSTTLAAMIDHINETRHDHILTIEDPVEFVHKQKNCLVNQREVHKHTTSFKRALKAALREDPDIILIGELRDLETIAIAIETAETGHLVFGTLHTNTAVSTVDRIIDQFPSNQQAQIRVMLAESLKGVVAQSLLKKKGGGRIAAHEILVVNKAISSLIREGKTHMVQNIMQTQKADGNILLNETLTNLVTQGVVDAKDAYLKAVDKDSLLNLYQQKGIRIDVGGQVAS